MIAEARGLYLQACRNPKPRDFIARWLVLDLTPRNVAICVGALYQLTGQVWHHPDTPRPTTLQKATCPDVWRTGVKMALAHAGVLHTVKVGDQHSLSMKFVNVHVGRGEGPEQKLVVNPMEQMRVRKTPEDIAAERARGPGQKQLRWVAPKRKMSREKETPLKIY